MTDDHKYCPLHDWVLERMEALEKKQNENEKQIGVVDTNVKIMQARLALLGFLGVMAGNWIYDIIKSIATR